MKDGALGFRRLCSTSQGSSSAGLTLMNEPDVLDTSTLMSPREWLDFQFWQSPDNRRRFLEKTGKEMGINDV